MMGQHKNKCNNSNRNNISNRNPKNSIVMTQHVYINVREAAE